MSLDVLHAMLCHDFGVICVVARVDDYHPALVEFEVALDQREGTAADGAKADHHDRASNFGIYRVGLFRHSFFSPVEGDEGDGPLGIHLEIAQRMRDYRL
jgi:hypothetical protein